MSIDITPKVLKIWPSVQISLHDLSCAIDGPVFTSIKLNPEKRI
jgi:hypothetical protein